LVGGLQLAAGAIEAWLVAKDRFRRAARFSM
jgi:hypothetical protein